MKFISIEEQRARIENLNSAERDVRKYFRRTRIRDYLPGQAVYNLGEYPGKISFTPTDYDREMIADMAKNGVELIQIHEDWNDSIRLNGADKYTCYDPEGLEKFIELCHSEGIKIIPYISSGYFHRFDPEFKEEFHHGGRIVECGTHFSYMRNSAGSAEWRNFVFPRTVAVLDRYDFDGIYNDCGTDSRYTPGKLIEKEGGIKYDPEIEDLLGLIYHEVKKRGGIYKIHCDGNNPAPCLDKVYDYIWIGEGMQSEDIGIGKNYPHFVVPCPDKLRIDVTDPDKHFASVIPFLQFPLLTARGRPMTGERNSAPVPRYGIKEGIWSEYAYWARVAEHYKAHPDGPYSYSHWSAVPDDVEEYPRWCRYLALYKPMVEENSLVYMEIRDCADVISPIPDKVYISMFVNEKKYLTVSNLTGSEYKLVLSEPWKDRESGEISREFTVAKDRIIFLVKP